MIQQRFIPSLLLAPLVLALACTAFNVWGAAAASNREKPQPRNSRAQATDTHDAGRQSEADGTEEFPEWGVESRLKADQWVGNWLISRDGEAQHVWSLNADGTGRSYAFARHGDDMRFAYGYDIRWYFDPFTQMANIRTERRIVCRGGRVYPYFLTLKSYESDYAVKGKYAWQTTWTEASIGRNYLHKSLVVFVAPLSGWHNPEKDAPCPAFPQMALERDLDTALDTWEAEAVRDAPLVDTTPVEGEPEFDGEEFGPSPEPRATKAKPGKAGADKARSTGKSPKQRGKSAH
ncbi:hypothetical protein ACNKU7_10460 [Microbulbifer sp. SA54]|uniref:hypothetical protein n=1 Tax=Microbulbifer sp. SA54 TaxID=3401577 RepID=UPI003AABC37E